MPVVSLTGGGVAQVDERDLKRVLKHKWTQTKTTAGQIQARAFVSNKPKRVFHYLHRFILGVESGSGYYVKAKNGDYLDCRRSNLVKMTREEYIEDQANIQQEKHGKKTFTETIPAKYRPYAQTKPGKHGWTVSIHIGTFPTRQEAMEQHEAACEVLGFGRPKKR